MEGHERWWDAIWRAAAERGDEEVFYSREDHDILYCFPDLLILDMIQHGGLSF